MSKEDLFSDTFVYLCNKEHWTNYKSLSEGDFEAHYNFPPQHLFCWILTTLWKYETLLDADVLQLFFSPRACRSNCELDQTPVSQSKTWKAIWEEEEEEEGVMLQSAIIHSLVRYKTHTP